MSEKISKKVFEKIKKEDVKMRSCGYFRICSFFWLSVAGFLFLLTTLIVGLDFYYLFNIKPWALFSHKPILVLFSLPYFFFAITILLFCLTAKSYRKSCNLCRHEEWMLLAILVFGVVLISLAINQGGIDRVYRVPLEKNKVYQKLVVDPKRFWSRPEKGVLSGVILNQKKEDIMTIRLLDGHDWEVLIPDGVEIRSDEMTEGKYIKMIGKKNDNKTFVALKVWRW